jgi:DNA modification methylase
MTKNETVQIAEAKGRPMLHWVGKRPLDHVTAFPAQLVERFDPAGELQTSEVSETSEVSGNLLFHGDNRDVLAWLLAHGYRGKVNLIYIDPPFDSGADYVRRVQLRGVTGVAKLEGETYTLGEQIQYTDIWANDTYLQFMYERLLLLKELVSSDGRILLHCNATRGHHLRFLMDEVFGSENFQNEIVWFYENKLGTGGSVFDSRHDTILLYRKGERWTHNDILVPVKEIKPQPVTQKIDGKRVWLRDEEGDRLYQDSQPTRPIGDVWTIPIINPVASERVGYPTQKPEALIEYIVYACSNAEDLVLDCFVGAGTTAVVAQKLGRRWIAADVNKGAIQTTSKRLQTVIREQIEAGAVQTSEVSETSEVCPPPAALSFSVYRVNDYDLQVQHNEAVNLAVELVGIERTKTDPFFDGTLGRRLVKIVPFNHPLTPLDLQLLQDELKVRPDEERDIVVVCLGKETAIDPWLEEYNKRRPVNKMEVIELRTDQKYGKFFVHQPAQAQVQIERVQTSEVWQTSEVLVVEIEDFISPTIVERLEMDTPLFKAQIPDWRAMVDVVLIDTTYNGEVFDINLSDVPERKNDLVSGHYELPAPDGPSTVAVKIIDMLGEEVLVTAEI